MLDGMSREFIENVILVLLLAFLVGGMAVGGFLLVMGIPAFARFIFIIWYVLTV